MLLSLKKSLSLSTAEEMLTIQGSHCRAFMTAG